MLAGAYRVLLPGEVHALRKAAEAKPSKAKAPRKPTRSAIQSASHSTKRSDKQPADGKPQRDPNSTDKATRGPQQRTAQQGSAQQGSAQQRPVQQRNTTQRNAQHPVARRIEQKFQI
jgi:hypothetical protein